MAEINSTNSTLIFKVTRQAAEVIRPVRPTPYECKELSNLDCIQEVRGLATLVQFYKNNPNKKPELDPAKVIKEAIAEALVPYYPLAGRLREADRGKLVVECTGEGVVFIEADCDVTLAEFGQHIHPPIPCLEELLFNLPAASDGVFHSPLLLFQVTRLKCGGFVFALLFNHTMLDGTGLAQFLNAVAELARGAEFPSTSPVWKRHLLRAANSPQVRCKTVDSYDTIGQKEDTVKGSIFPPEDMVHKCFFFGQSEVGRLRQSVSESEEGYTSFELITAHIWRCRAIAFHKDPQELVHLKFAVNIRYKLDPPLLPTGYYGNALVSGMAQTTAGEISGNPIRYAAQLVKRSKCNINKEYIKSLLDIPAVTVNDRLPVFQKNDGLIVTDHTRLGFDRVDFGWDKPVFGGYPKEGFEPHLMGYISCYSPFQYSKETGVLVPISLPRFAMNKFVKLVRLKDSEGINISALKILRASI